MFFYPYKFITFASVMALCIRERVKCVCFTVIMVCMFVSCTRQGTDGSLANYHTLLADELTEEENIHNPERLIQIITDLSMSGSLTTEEASYQRAMIHFDVAMNPIKAAPECFSILDSRFIRRNVQAHMHVYEILAQYYHLEKQYKLSMEYAMKGRRMAQQQNDSVMNAVFNYNLLKSQIDLGSGYYYDELEELIPVLESSSEPFVQVVLAHIYSDEIGDQWDVENYDEIIDYGTRCLAVLDKLGKTQMLDELRAKVAAVMARSYVAMGEPEKAQAVFEQALHTDLVKTRPGCFNLLGYYLDTDQLQKIPELLNAPEDKSRFDEYTWANMALLTDLQAYYDRVGQTSLVEQTGMQMDVVRDSIVHREHHLGVEKATIMSEMKVDEVQRKLSAMQRYQQWLIGVLIVLLLVTVYLAWSFFRQKKERNRKIVELNNTLDYLYPVRPGAEEQKPADVPALTEELMPQEEQEVDEETLQDVLQRMNELIVNEKLYLNENITREDMARRLHVDKAILIQSFRKFLNDCTMPSLLNRYRVQHAIALMKSQPNYTVQAIAEDSGFSNVRKFYRIFKDEMGMTPTEYREAMESGEGSVLSPPYISTND